MSKIQDAIVALDQMRKQYNAFKEIDAVITAMAGAEQHKKELDAKVAEAKKASADAASKLADVQLEVANCKADAARIINQANEESAAVIKAAKVQADKMLADATAKVKATAEKLALTDSRLAEREKQEAAALARIQALEAKEAEVEANIKTMRENLLAKLTGG